MSSCKLCVWNARGFNHEVKSSFATRYCHRNSINLIAIIETKVLSRKEAAISRRMAKDWISVSNSTPSSAGRIWLWWNPSYFTVDIRSLSSQAIHCHVHSVDTDFMFFATFVYASSRNRTARNDCWNFIKQLRVPQSDPWAVMGDFNCILCRIQMCGHWVVPLEQIVKSC